MKDTQCLVSYVLPYSEPSPNVPPYFLQARGSVVSPVGDQIAKRETERLPGKSCELFPDDPEQPHLPSELIAHLSLHTQKLVATADANETYTTFTGVTRLKQGITPNGTFIPENEARTEESSVQLTRSVTVPAPSTSWDSDGLTGMYLTVRDRQRGSDQSGTPEEVQHHHQCYPNQS